MLPRSPSPFGEGQVNTPARPPPHLLQWPQHRRQRRGQAAGLVHAADVAAGGGRNAAQAAEGVGVVGCSSGTHAKQGGRNSEGEGEGVRAAEQALLWLAAPAAAPANRQAGHEAQPTKLQLGIGVLLVPQSTPKNPSQPQADPPQDPIHPSQHSKRHMPLPPHPNPRTSGPAGPPPPRCCTPSAPAWQPCQTRSPVQHGPAGQGVKSRNRQRAAARDEQRAAAGEQQRAEAGDEQRAEAVARQSAAAITRRQRRIEGALAHLCKCGGISLQRLRRLLLRHQVGKHQGPRQLQHVPLPDLRLVSAAGRGRGRRQRET